MAIKTNTAPSRFHNVSDAGLADMIGQADAVVKGAEAELKALKEEFKRRALAEVAGDDFVVTATDQTSWRLDAVAVRKHLGDACHRFDAIVHSTVVRIKPCTRFAAAA